MSTYTAILVLSRAMFRGICRHIYIVKRHIAVEEEVESYVPGKAGWIFSSGCSL